MNRKLSFLLAVILTTFAASLYSVSTGAAVNRPSANGHGNVTLNELRTFSFHAETGKDGTVSGNATLHNRDQNIFTQLDINCLSVTGNTAVMTGVVSNSSDPAFAGLRGIFRVVDNGEGANAPPDQLTLLFLFAPSVVFDCTTAFNAPLLAVEGGNIQVKP